MTLEENAYAAWEERKRTGARELTPVERAWGEQIDEAQRVVDEYRRDNNRDLLLLGQPLSPLARVLAAHDARRFRELAAELEATLLGGEDVLAHYGVRAAAEHLRAAAKRSEQEWETT